ncbi:hypothetical protein CLIB1444_03S04544 [[Candida] jaroonii]|uniref:Uncharacterized protein n=1 Tax=[Candida] jaroonii TaxID=467808 RepID=A0ACA9Y5Q5_9ASCO|nr:hypothetical protein CLIB1444_03S04544 [[Candida] jaroonii]
MDKERLLDSEAQIGFHIEMEEVDDELIDILRSLNFGQGPYSMEQLESNLNSIRVKKANLKVLKYLRNKYLLIYDALLQFNPSDPQHPYILDFETMPFEIQLKTLLLNITLYRKEVYDTYKEAQTIELSKKSKLYALGKKLGFTADSWEMLLAVGFIIIIVFLIIWLVNS